MRIAVCDYNPASAAAVRDMIEQFCKLYDKAGSVHCFHSPAELHSCGEYFEIVYMAFGGGAGFLAARELRERDQLCKIILVDDTSEYAIRGVHLHCTDFILRPVKFRQIVQSMKLALGGTL